MSDTSEEAKWNYYVAWMNKHVYMEPPAPLTIAQEIELAYYAGGRPKEVAKFRVSRKPE